MFVGQAIEGKHCFVLPARANGDLSGVCHIVASCNTNYLNGTSYSSVTW